MAALTTQMAGLNAIRSNQEQSGAIRSNQEQSEAHQKSSEAIRSAHHPDGRVGGEVSLITREARREQRAVRDVLARVRIAEQPQHLDGLLSQPAVWAECDGHQGARASNADDRLDARVVLGEADEGGRGEALPKVKEKG